VIVVPWIILHVKLGMGEPWPTWIRADWIAAMQWNPYEEYTKLCILNSEPINVEENVQQIISAMNQAYADAGIQQRVA
jgi:hypothetical protein